jgi:hypothetical protein
MESEQQQAITVVVLLCVWLVFYMFLVSQFWFVMLKHNVPLSDVLLRFKFRGLAGLLQAKKNPEDYIKARWLLFGVLACLLLPLIFWVTNGV